MAKSITVKCAGLYTNSNPIGSVPEGSLVTADNLVVDRNDIIEPRRGFGLYNSRFGSNSSVSKNVIDFKNTLILHYGDNLVYERSVSITNISVAISTVITSPNHALTTGDYVSISDSNSTPTIDGVHQVTTIDNNSFSIPVTVSIAGTSGTLYTWKPYYDTLVNITSTTFGSTTVTVTANAHGFSNGDNVTIKDSTNGIDGTYVISSVTTNTFNVSVSVAPSGTTTAQAYRFEKVSEAETGVRIKGAEYNGNLFLTTAKGIRKLDNIDGSFISSTTLGTSHAGVPQALSVELDSTTPYGSGGSIFTTVGYQVAYRVVWGYKDSNNNVLLGTPSQRLTFKCAALTDSPNLRVYIPQGITTSHFYQIYRSDEAVLANDTLRLLVERNPSQAEITARVTNIYNDISSDDLLGQELYTNQGQEGILESNDEPPFAKDITLYNNIMFYANTKTKFVLNSALLSAGLTAGTDHIVFRNLSGSTFTITFDNVEDIATGKALISPSPDDAIAIGDTARSLVRVLNAYSANTFLTAYYISSDTDLPGQILFKNIDVSGSQFYAYSNIPTKFNPNLVNSTAISAWTSGNSVTITSTSHGLIPGDNVDIFGTGSFDGQYTVKKKIDNNNFIINTSFSVTAGSGGSVVKLYLNKSTNEEIANRVYFSKQGQPEAVPSGTHYLDFGARNKPIRRILGALNSMFVLKDDGIYKVNGSTVSTLTPTTLDVNSIIVAQDSAVIHDNFVFFLGKDGITRVSDTGAQIISEPIKNLILDILPYNNVDINKLKSTCFGISNVIDHKYILFTVTNYETDNVATQAFVFNTIYNKFTRWPITATCGLTSSNDNKIYLGNNDTNYLSQERNTNTYKDYADRANANIIGNVISPYVLQLDFINNIAVGDVLSQVEYLRIQQFNNVLAKLDLDPLVHDTNYTALLAVTQKSQLFTNFNSLLTKLVADVGGNYYTDFNIGTSTDPTLLQAKFNGMVDALNTDSNIGFHDYVLSIGTTTLETLITSVNTLNSQVTVNLDLDYLTGAITIYKGINAVIQWVPIHAGDPHMLKHFRESLYVFTDYSFEGATVAFSSDLSQDFTEIAFSAGGTGAWGTFDWGNVPWGGDVFPKAFRTYIPQFKQRCRQLSCRFTHYNAFERFSLSALSLVLEANSERVHR